MPTTLPRATIRTQVTIPLRLADGSRCPEIPYPASVTYADALPGVFWRSARGEGARWTWEWWIAPLPPASFEIRISWDEGDVPSLRASIDGDTDSSSECRDALARWSLRGSGRRT